MKRIRFEYKIVAIMTLVLALVAITGFYSYSRFSKIVANVNESVRPDETLIVSQELINRLNEAELSAKSFRITSDSLYLQAFYGAVRNVDQKLEELKLLNKKSSDHEGDIDSLEVLVFDKLAVLSDLLLLQDPYRVQTALDHVIERVSDPESTATLPDNSRAEELSLFNRIFKRSAKDTSRDSRGQPELAALHQEVEKIRADEYYIEQDIKTSELSLIIMDQHINERISMVFDHMMYVERESIRTQTESAQIAIRETNLQVLYFMLAIGILIVFLSYVVIKYLINSRKYRVALLSARRQAFEHAEAKQRFLANMSHEIRTPLNAIIGFSEQLSKNSSEEQRHKQIDIIKKSADHLLYLVNSVLDYSKMQADKITLEERAFNAVELVQETIEMVQSIQLNKSVPVVFEHNLSSKVNLLGDPLRLRQILLNLISNSIKFTSQGQIKVSLELKDDENGMISALIGVEDTGIGMTEEEIERAFQEFEQADHSTTWNYGGTGLGLAIVKRLVALHHGKIDVKSKRGSGTRVELQLLYKNAADVPVNQKAQPLQADHLRGKSILIVDDEDYNRRLLEVVLNAYGMKTSEAKDGNEAYAVLSKNKYDLVLMDVRMPGMSGTEVARKIRSNPENPNYETTIIIVTAALSEQDKLDYKHAGIDGFLTKPVTENILISEMAAIDGWKQGIPEQPKKQVEVPEDVPGDQVIALENLERSSGGDHVFYLEMLSLFLDSAKDGIKKMRDAYTISDWKNLGEQAHKLAAPAKHMGAMKLYPILKDIEAICFENGNFVRLGTLLRAAELEAEWVVSAVTRELEQALKQNET